jgi:hypothetical protein
MDCLNFSVNHKSIFSDRIHHIYVYLVITFTKYSNPDIKKPGTLKVPGL